MIVLTILAAVALLGCAAACTRRLYYASHPIAFHPAIWLDRIKRGDGAVVARAAAADPNATWEREILSAVSEPDPLTRTARVNEQLGELDYLAARWARVPRVCASVASSAGLLFGSLVLRFGLTAAGDAPEEIRSDAINAVVLQAVTVAALGVAGAAFAIAAQYHARRLAKAFHRDADLLVEALEQKGKS